MGARLVFADSETIVKFGHGVRLAEVEALHMASTRTTIAAPKLLSAYVIDGTGYIVMSYERGEPLEHYLGPRLGDRAKPRSSTITRLR